MGGTFKVALCFCSDFSSTHKEREYTNLGTSSGSSRNEFAGSEKRLLYQRVEICSKGLPRTN